MPLADYLAKNYLTADKSSKKRKRKHAGEGLTITDDADDFTSSRHGGSDDEFRPVVVDSGRSSSKRTNWKTVGTAAPTNAEQTAADAILASAIEEQAARAAAAEGDGPTIADVEPDYAGPTMASGAMAGLQTAAQITASLARREAQEKKAMQEAGLDAGGIAQETVYRDASGRRIDVAMKRAELRRKAEEEQKKKDAEREGARGDVQRREKERRRDELDNAKTLKVARYADDEAMNREMKEKERWNDPMAQMLADTGVTGRTSKRSRRKVYEGAAEPNRYGIKPGYRWDGVDRSNGFERKWFASRNKQQSRKELEYAWEMDE